MTMMDFCILKTIDAMHLLDEKHENTLCGRSAKDRLTSEQAQKHLDWFAEKNDGNIGKSICKECLKLQGPIRFEVTVCLDDLDQVTVE